MHKTTIYLDDDLYERVRRIAQAEGCTQAAVIRRAVERLTSDDGVRLPRSMGLGRGPSDLSRRADEHLHGFGEDG